MSPRPWPMVPVESVPPEPRTVIDYDFKEPVPGLMLCPCGPGQGCERHGTHPRRDVPHSTRSGVGRVGALRWRSC